MQELAQALRPEIKNWSLEAVAEWLSVEIDCRHRALPDAKLAAELFCRLAPMLQDAGIATVGEARNACRTVLTKTTEAGRRTLPARPEADGLRSFPYNRRVADKMSCPAAVIDQNSNLRDAVRTMVEKGITSLFVSGFPDGALGILTESDVMRALSCKDSHALEESAGKHCSRPLKAVSDREFLYRAVVLMTSHCIRHLGVTDGSGELIGAITAKDALGGPGAEAVSLGAEIEAASTPAELGRVWSELHSVASSLSAVSVAPNKVAAIISRELRAMTAKSCEIALSQIIPKLGGPPAKFAVLVLGSGGRGESLLAMDQDNAIVFEGEQDGQADWFLEFGKMMTQILQQAGVKLCPGKVMASNPDWCRHKQDWGRTVSEWMNRTDSGDLMNVDIFFDAMPVFGHSSTAEHLRQAALDAAMGSRAFIARLSKKACEINHPFGFLGQWKLNYRGRTDFKMHGLMPLFSAARALALNRGIAARSTAGRLGAAAKSGACDPSLAEDLAAAHAIILGAVLRQQIRDSESGIALTNCVAPKELSNYEKQELKWAFGQVPRVADLLGVPAVF